MFTGLVELTGEVLAVTPTDGGARMVLNVPFASEMKLGDSLAVNGCCLTVDAIEGSRISFDILSQTLRVTGLGDLKAGDFVNMERAMKADDRLGGHFVMGHVDTCGKITSLESVGQDHRLEVEIPAEYSKYCIDKGSVTIDGMSLTIANLSNNVLEFWITPHTFDVTRLKYSEQGMLVNVEVDMLAKYVEKLFSKLTP